MTAVLIPTIILTVLLAMRTSCAQWTVQNSNVTADLRGIDYLGNGVAWASGTNGTILRTEDLGVTWQMCAVPPEAKDLDFRGVQVFDMDTAIVMSSGPGEKSRLYKTTDRCKTWTLLFMNPDKNGFFDSVHFLNKEHGYLLGDPIGGYFIMAETYDGGSKWSMQNWGPVLAAQGEAAFAASNSLIVKNSAPDVGFNEVLFATGGGPHARIVFMQVEGGGDSFVGHWKDATVPMAAQVPSAGIFSVVFRDKQHGVSVGGDFLKPNSSAGTAAYTTQGSEHWLVPQSMPHGYRSSVAYDEQAKTWITVGPNGTDASIDDGRTWRALKPGPGDTPNADDNWNALSLPFVVGPKGRIGILLSTASSVNDVQATLKR